MVTRISKHHPSARRTHWDRQRPVVRTGDWQRCRHRSARWGSTGAPLAANQPAISASTERQWQGIHRPNPDRAKERAEELLTDPVKDPLRPRVTDSNRTRVPIRDPGSNGTRPAGITIR